MPYLSAEDQLARILAADVTPSEGIASLIDRSSGLIPLAESQLLDYKLKIDVGSESSVGELARDILAFSNAQGGLLIFGVNDTHLAVGINDFNPRLIRDTLGPYLGTRVVYDLDSFKVNVRGTQVTIAFALIPKTSTTYPHLLRKDVTPQQSFIRKPKYVKGSLFFRSDDSIVTESPYGDVDGWARELGFSGAGPRTSSSFLVIEDKPLLRLYSQINERFFGRVNEVNRLTAEFDNPQGRGISIAGFGGLGKTELAINIVSRLHRNGRFKLVYSASAKQTVLGSTGVQVADPIFIDLKGFLLDFCGWLGLNISSSAATDQLKSDALRELAKLKDHRILVFVDNLETVRDRDLFHFLDYELPNNCWIIATSRIHKLRKYLLPIELEPMDNNDAARLLRYELKRQGLSTLSGLHIDQIARKADALLNHPLAVRWYAWACRKDPSLWDQSVHIGDLKQIEEFCVSSTLSSLDEDSLRTLASILAIDNASEATIECIQNVAAVGNDDIDRILWDLECSGMLTAAIDENGSTTYSVSPMAETSSSEIARQRGWEREFVQRLKKFVSRNGFFASETPLVRDLLAIRTQSIRTLPESDKEEIIRRVDRAVASASPTDRLRLLWRKAECTRHLQQAMTADNIYSECAEAVLQSEGGLPADERWHLLLEAATVARARAATRFQIEKAIRYLEAAERIEADNTRVVGMLAELHGLLGDRGKVAHYSNRASVALQFEDPDSNYTHQLELALGRAKENLTRSPLR